MAAPSPLLALPLAAALLLTGCAAPGAPAEMGGTAADAAPYAGLDRSPIRGLTEQEILELRSGAGMRLALPAELNGYPGPKHMLELRAELGLNADQEARTQALREATVAGAREAGREVLAAYQALDLAFREGRAHGEALDALLQDVADAEAALRGVHLRAHLEAMDILTPEQVAKYAELRGYAGSSPEPSGDAHAGHGSGHAH